MMADEDKNKKLILELSETGKEISEVLHQLSAFNKILRDFIEHKGLLEEFGEWYVDDKLDKILQQRAK